MSEPEDYSDDDYDVVEEEMSDCDHFGHDHYEEEQMSPEYYSDEHYEEEAMTDEETDCYCDEHYAEVQMSEPDHFSDENQEEDYMSDPDPYGDEQDEGVQMSESDHFSDTQQEEGMTELNLESDEDFARVIAENEEVVATLTAERKSLMTTIRVLEADVECLKVVLDILEEPNPESQNAGDLPIAPDPDQNTGSVSSEPSLAPALSNPALPESAPTLADTLSETHNELKNLLSQIDSDLSAPPESEPDHISDGEMSDSVHSSDDEDYERILRNRVVQRSSSLFEQIVLDALVPPALRPRPARPRGRRLIAIPQIPSEEFEQRESFEDHVARLQLIEITDEGDPAAGDNHPHVCSTCVTNRISYMVTPCNHVSLCGPCVRIHRQGLKSDEGFLLNYVRCPNCAQKVEGYTRVFL